MAETRHTPGPWVVDEGLHGSIGVWAGDRLIAGMEYRGEQPRKDATLIASAPELLEALRSLLETMVGAEVRDDRLSVVELAARRAIAKAEGRHG